VKGEAKSAEYANEARLERMKRKHFFWGGFVLAETSGSVCESIITF
jgi:hypothetical protein